MKRAQTVTLILLVLMAAAPSQSGAAGKGDPKAGKAKYDLLCSSCHGTTGKGDGPAAAALNPKPRSLADVQYMKGLTDDHLFKVIKDGGPAVGKSPLMAPWGGQLKDPEIWDVVAYIRTLGK
ncbi:MAG: c-type cytochrome [candidate division NC10 bacterium]|nr:c-type cytochrome [candidate division NC10 bacterium]